MLLLLDTSLDVEKACKEYDPALDLHMLRTLEAGVKMIMMLSDMIQLLSHDDGSEAPWSDDG
jgi:hypothetical protein